MRSFLEYVRESHLGETLKHVKGKWALVSHTGRPLAYYRGAGKPSEDWVRKQERRVQYFKHQTESADDDYRGLHTAPDAISGAPLHDLTGDGRIYPDDVYSSRGMQYYGTGDSVLDRITFAIIHRAKGKPSMSVVIYRAVPNDPTITEIHRGDWVTINRQYAKNHGESALRGNYKLLTKTVRASDIFTNGDSIHEWGYQGP